MKNGRIIFLNGTSCAGKTSIAKSIQTTLGEPCFYIGIDSMLGSLILNKYFTDDPFLYLGDHPLESRDKHNQPDEDFNELMDNIFPKFLKGFNASISAYANSGITVVLDHLLHEKEWLLDCIEALKNNNVYFIGVKCGIDVLNERERSRAERYIGMAEYQSHRVHKYCEYDLEIDTTNRKPSESADLIKNFFRECREPKAFDNMYRKYFV